MQGLESRALAVGSASVNVHTKKVEECRDRNPGPWLWVAPVYKGDIYSG